MSGYRYTLEPYKGMKTRHQCPNCNHRDKTFALYVDATGKPLHTTVGRCNRESKCGYHYTPKEFSKHNEPLFDDKQVIRPKFKPNQLPLVPSYIEPIIFKESLKSYEQNHFVQFLSKHFGDGITSSLIEKYFIGTSKHWQGATVFWQIDTKGKIRTGKIMLYKPETGKRVKEPKNCITWTHTALQLPNFELRQCFFGEHLLKDKTKPIALVESEKTAIIASAYLPEFIWLATGGFSNLTAEKCAILKGRAVVLFPDIGAFDKWKGKANEFDYQISDLLERKASAAEKEQGLDLADYLIKYELSEFVKQPYPVIKSEKPFCAPAVTPQPELEANIAKPSKNWDREIADLENYFAAASLPEQVRLNKCSTITDVAKFVGSHINIVKANNGNVTFLPYLERLQLLQKILNEAIHGVATTPP